jgi:hypothetical protein
VLTVDLSKFADFVKDLDYIRERSIPYAVRNTLNEAAFEGRKLWLAEIKGNLTLRNSWTVRSLQVSKASGADLRTMQAVLGSIAKYMDDVEQGETHRASGKHGVAIPTPSAAGQAQGAKARTKAVRRASWLSAISAKKRPVTGRRQTRNAGAIAIAARSGGGFVFLDLGRRKGIFRVDGRKRGVKIRMVYDLSRKTVTSGPRPTLGTTIAKLSPRIPEMGRRACIDQLKRTVFRTGGR